MGWLLLLAFVLSGCAPLTSVPMAISATPHVELPAAGRPLNVRVFDDRLGDPPAWLGFEQGGNVARDLVLEGEDSLAHRMSRDVMISLRSKGFRAEERNGPAELGATALDIRIARFALTVHARGFSKPAWQASWAFVGSAYAEGEPEPLWTDFIFTMHEESLSTWSLKKYQETIEGYYREAISEIVARFMAVVTPEVSQ
jgi:hypothetical protein